MKEVKLFAILIIVLSSCSSIGPKTTFGFYKGDWCRKMITYNYPKGTKTKMDKFIYHKGNLVKEVRYTERWPNGEYHFISKKGFVVFEDDEYVFAHDSVQIPDNMIYSYYDTSFVEHFEVYQNNVRIPYTLGRQDGYQSLQYLRNPPGVYSWKDGKEFFLREFTDQEWESHRLMNEYLNQNFKKDSL